MGVTYGIHCATCRANGPEVGDAGFIGFPSLLVGRKRDYLTFGAIYEPLRDLAAINTEVAAIRDFMAAHAEHTLDMNGDGIGWEPSGVPPDTSNRFEYAGPSQEGSYVVHCSKCDESFESTRDVFVPFENLRLTSGAVGAVQRLLPRLEGNHDRTAGFPFDREDASDFAEFLKAHRKHPLEARLEVGDSTREVLEPKQTGRLHALPEGAPREHEGYLGEVPDEFLPVLARLNNRDSTVRAEACRTTGESGLDGSLGYVVARLDDPELAVRLEAIRAIGRLRLGRGARALGRVCLEAEPEIVAAATEALDLLNVDVTTAIQEARAPRGPYFPADGAENRVDDTDLRSHSEKRRYWAAERALRDNNRRPALARVLAVDPSSIIRADGIAAFRSLDAVTSQLLELLLEDKSDSLARAIARVLPMLAVPTPVLMRVMSSRSQELVAIAAQLLASRGDLDETSLHLLWKNGGPSMRRVTLELATRRQFASFLPYAISALDDEDPPAGVLDAIVVLSRQGEGLRLLLERWSRAKPALQARLLGLVAEVRSPEVDAMLLGGLVSEHAEVRLAAAHEIWAHHASNSALMEGFLNRLAAGDDHLVQPFWRQLIGLGDARCERALVKYLFKSGDLEVAWVYLASGNTALRTAVAEEWPELIADVTRPDGTMKLPQTFTGEKWRWGAKSR